MEMRLRVIDFGVDKYGLNAYLYDSTDDGTTNYDRVLFSPTKNGDDSVGDLAEGEWADVKVTVIGGALAGKTAGMLVKVETLNDDLSQVRLFHTSVTRAIASWPTWPGEPGYTELRRVPRGGVPDVDGRRLRDPRGRHRQRGHLRRAGQVLVDRPLADARVRRRRLRPRPADGRHADDRRVPAPVPRPGQPDAAERRPQPGVRRRPGRRRPGRPGGQAQGLHPRGLPRVRPDAGARAQPDGQGPDDVHRLRPRLRPAVPGHRRQQGAGRPRAAVAPADLQLPAGDRRDDRQGQGLLRRRRRADLPQPGRARPRRHRRSPRCRPTRRPRPWPRSRRPSWR